MTFLQCFVPLDDPFYISVPEEFLAKKTDPDEMPRSVTFYLDLCCLPKYSKILASLNGHSKKDRKLVFNTNYRLMQVKSIAECSNGSIVQYFRPSLSYHLPLSIFEWLYCTRLRLSCTLKEDVFILSVSSCVMTKDKKCFQISPVRIQHCGTAESSIRLKTYDIRPKPG